MNDLLEELQQCGDWFDILSAQHDAMRSLQAFLTAEEEEFQILPVAGKRFNALRLTPLDKVKIVVTGQDPYPGMEGEVPHAMGLSFSVAPGVKPPRSLNNIYKELESELGLARPDHGDLRGWAEQGVLMLNSVLTVRQGEAASHAKKGWEQITRAVLEAVNAKSDPVCFLAWGKHSHKLMESVDEKRHKVIRTSHPSPLGARKAGVDFEAFLGSRCFGLANSFLQDAGRDPIDWGQLQQAQ